MRIHETTTKLPAAEVIERARSFFTLASTPYASFEEKVGEGYLKLFLEVGEIVIGCVPREDGTTLVRGSASRGEHLLTSFLTTLAPPLDARQVLHRHGVREARAALVSAPAAQAEPAAAQLTPAA